jgi:hypothetical protein
MTGRAPMSESVNGRCGQPNANETDVARGSVPMLCCEGDFLGFRQLKIVAEEREIHEGTSHGGMSAVINLTGRKPVGNVSSIWAAWAVC